MRRAVFVRFYGLLLLLLGMSSSLLSGQSVMADHLKCDQESNPIGVETPTPRFSWQLQALSRGVMQTAYHIIVADTPEAIARGEGNVWNSQKVVSSQSLLVPYNGKPLEAGKKYYWSVRVWDNTRQFSPWSRVAEFSMGLLSPDDWSKARWIALESDVDSLIVTDGLGRKHPKIGFYQLPQLRKEFSVDRPVRRAVAYICGLGQFELFLNGEKTGDHFMDPAWTKFDKNVQYVSFDVTPQIQQGENAIGVMLGNGFFNIPNERYTKFVGSYGAPKMIMKLQVEYMDGTNQVVVSDASWRATQSPITFSSIYGGEDYDASRVQEGWNTPGFDDNQWQQVALPIFNTTITSQRTTPLTVRQSLPTVRRYKNSRGNYLYDLGQNASGIVRLCVKADGQRVIRMFPSEMQGADSTANQRSSGAPYILSYTTRGDGTPESWQPQFTYYGFRYVEVEGAVPAGEPNPDGLPEIQELCGLHTTNSAEQAGAFSCSNPLFNQIYTLIDWAIRSNFSSVFTDCPHREKLGWLEQSHLIGPSVQYGYNISRAFPKIVNDMALAQNPNGMVPTIAPQYTIFSEGFRDTPEWGSAYVIIPWYLYRWYGDSKPLQENYEKMAQYVDYLSSRSENHIVAYGLGDWCDIGPGEPSYSQLTSNGVSATAIYYYDICIMQQVADLFGKREDAAKYAALAAQVKQAFNEKYFNKETQKYDRNSQAANAMALYMGLVEPPYEQVVLDNLIEDIRRQGLTAGDVGFRYVVQTLLDHGASEVLFAMNSRYDVPGYGYQLAKGETALAESWQSKDYLSHNHCMLGHLYSWFFNGLGGVVQAPGSVAYKEIVIDPQVVGDIRSARVSFQSPYGLIRSEWSAAPNLYTQTIEVPANTTARIYLPTNNVQAIFENGQPVSRVKGIVVEKPVGQKSCLRVGSGVYNFTVVR